jgi:Coenzyme PQQ synthesis protein D (PqqD)
MLTAPLKLRDDINWREIDGEIVLLDLSGSMYFSVNRTGIELWPLLIRGSTADELSGHLAQTFSLDRQTAERDVRSFLDALSGEGLLQAQA